MTAFRTSMTIVAAIALSAGLAACAQMDSEVQPTNQLVTNSTPAPDLIGKTVAAHLDGADRTKLLEATSKAAETGQKQTFTSSKGEKVTAHKTGKPEVIAAEGGQKKKCQKVEQQVVKAGGKVDRDVVQVCGEAA